MKKNSKIHSLLARQLNRSELDFENLPNDLDHWQEFIRRINNTYQEADQERYLLERSMNLSSQELLDLNQKLENAQHIAQLGYWSYNKKNEKTYLSNEAYSVLGLDPLKKFPSYKEFRLLIHEEDLPILEKLTKNAFYYGKDYECEIRIKHPSGKYRWFSIVGYLNQPDTLSGIVIDITRRKKTENEIKKLNNRLIRTARRAGMADVATSVLHNVGNILNSANVSLTLIKENIIENDCEKLLNIIEILSKKLPKNPNYLKSDQKGKLINEYLSVFKHEIVEKNIITDDEIKNLFKNLEQIKEIVSMQTVFSSAVDLKEPVYINELINIAIQINLNSLQSKKITVKKEFNSSPFTFLDKTKLLNIIINLILNAKQSVLESNKNKKEISIFLNENKKNKTIKIEVCDNGIGISSKNINSIFSFGFTTKKEGHGFGLHSSALAARELGGKLIAKSKGINKGATFELTLPSISSTKKVGSNEKSK